MIYDRHLTASGWSDYELLDSGDTMKLERFSGIIVARPETQALWRKQRPELWGQAHAVFAFRDKRGGWEVNRDHLCFGVSLVFTFGPLAYIKYPTIIAVFSQSDILTIADILQTQMR
jgi:hypothetical protein